MRAVSISGGMMITQGSLRASNRANHKEVDRSGDARSVLALPINSWPEAVTS